MRIVSGMMLATAIGLTLGCGSSAPPPSETKPTPASETPTTNTPVSHPQKDETPTPTPPTKESIPGKMIPVPVPAPTASWEMDTAKHQIPSIPVTGKLAGATFTPEVQFLSDSLRFRILKDGIPERQLTIQFSPERAKTLASGLKLVVKPEQPNGPDVPTVLAEFPPPKSGETGAVGYANGYAMTLELGKRQKDKLPGSIYLSLPGEPAHEFLAGTFTAEWVRPVTEPPGADDAPFIIGKVTIAAATKAQLKVGYVGLPKAGDFAIDALQMPFVDAGRWARSDFYRPRMTTLIAADSPTNAARYEHTKLPPCRYLVYAAIADGGPAVWKWVNLAPDAQITADLAIDPAKVGSLEVTVPADMKGKIQLAPADDPKTPIPPDLFLGISVSLGLQHAIEKGPVKFEKLMPGHYEVHAGDLSGVVEIKAGETAKLDLKKK